MDDNHLLCIAALVIIAYAIHQVTVGGDGIYLSMVVGALCALGGVILGKKAIVGQG